MKQMKNNKNNKNTTMFYSMKVQLAMMFIGLMVAICIAIGVANYISSARLFSSYTADSLMLYTIQAAKVVEERVKSDITSLETFALSPTLISDKATNIEKLNLLNKKKELSNYKKVGIADLSGNLITTDQEELHISDQKYFQGAIQGISSVTSPFYSKTTKEFLYSFAVPLRDDSGNIIGAIVATLDGNELINLTNDLKFGERGEAYIINSLGTMVAHPNEEYIKNMYNVSSVVSKDASLKELSKLHDKMLQGDTGYGQYIQDGQARLMGYAPIGEMQWYLAITAPKSDIMSIINQVTSYLLQYSAAFIVISIIIILLISRHITKPIISIAHYIGMIATGDLTIEIPDGLRKRKDESGVLARSLDAMKNTTHDMVHRILDSSQNLNHKLEDIFQEMEKLDQSMNEISSTTEELSASIEENAASSEEMNASANEIEESSEYIAKKAQDSIDIVTNISEMSNDMKERAIASKQTASKLYKEAKENAVQSIEKAKAVKTIHELSDTILGITAQTNLLSLNASIEAARAGEHGRGFAVVAHEISKLADDSSKAANSIQDVTKIIYEAVSGLTKNTEDILEFIDREVLKDYETSVDNSRLYSKQAVGVQEIISEFSATSEELLASIHSIGKVIGEMTQAVTQEADEANTIAEEVGRITTSANNIIVLSESAKDLSKELTLLVEKFKI